MATPSIVGATATTGADGANTTTTIVTLPTFTDGDSLYILINSDPASQVFGLPYDTVGSSTGFVALYSNIDIPATTPVGTFALFYLNNATHARFFDGSGYSCTCPVTTTERQAWVCWAVSNDGGIGAQGTNQTGTGTTATVPGLTTSANNSLVIGIVAGDSTQTSWTDPTGYTLLATISGTSAANNAVWYQTKASAGAISSQTSTLGTSRAWRGISFEIKATLEIINRPDVKPIIRAGVPIQKLRI